MRLPNDVTPGQPVSAKDFNLLLRYLRASTVSGGPGIMVSRSMAGTTIRLTDKPRSGLPADSIVHPFLVSDASTETDAKISMRSGSVNDVVPGGIAPTLQTLNTAGTWRIYLELTLDFDGTVLDVDVGATSSTQPLDSDLAAYITIATATVSSPETDVYIVDEINQLITHSLRFFACGRESVGESVTVMGTYHFWGV